MAKLKLNAFGKKVVGWLIAGVIGLVLGICLTVFFQNYNPPDKSKMTEPSVVFERIVSQNELVSVSQNYNIVDKSTDNNELFGFVIPGTGNSFWYRYAGTLKAGVSLQDAKFETEENVIRVTLPHPYIISNTPDMEKSGVLEENNNIFNPIHIEDVDAFRAECVSAAEQEAVAGGLLEEARAGAEKNIAQMFYAAFGDQYEVEFVWVEQSEATSGDLEGGQDDGSDGGQGDAESGDGGQEQ